MNRALPLLLLLTVGCGPLHYVRKTPITPPQPIEAPGLSVPVGGAGDCGRFTFSDLTGWAEKPWLQPGGEIDTIEPGDRHPAVGEDGLVRCRSVSISPGWWVVSREARERYPLMQNQLELWRWYSDRAAVRHQRESEEIAELLKTARRRQVQSFFVGTGAGAGVLSVVILSIVLAGR